MFLKDKKFWLNLTIASGGVTVIVILCFLSFGWYTRHNQIIEVPNVVGLSYDEAKKNLESRGFIVEVVDSVFEIPSELKDSEIQFGDVMLQNPKPNEMVKKGRRFYLTIRTSTPPMVDMPNLVDLSIRQAKSSLESKGLLLDNTTFNSDWPVSRQLYNGQIIEPGTKIPKGSVIKIEADSVDLKTGELLTENNSN